MAAPKIWALVTNGVRAHVLRGLEGKDPIEPIELESKAASTHLRDIMADKPGRSFTSAGTGRRSAMELGSDPVHREMQDFARETFGLLERHHRQKDFEKLAILAAPQMLGILRQEMPESLRDAVILERSTNLVQLPVAELRDTVRHMLTAMPRG